ncbi:type VI secretion system tube protein Hcp [Pseudomonas sp. DTU12.3]|uniref:Type VI secretion system secreted protein Hcp n=1 Tax=Pseudomonas helmanticensis TaxID=1471381 RepID=A0ACD2U7X2_9PSED|nr:MULTISPECIES: Hcp family type VI secretion system effector [Pseudomonas]QAX83120.1 type VI secretion system tube protein Hcp [Pseudomonas sp. DTU12.3]SMQ27053.1 type VI secretion system secreted protein Hcp [Pseudomonas helmanticensis]
MPIPAFMTLHGSRQGLISAGAFTEASVGNSYQSGREDKIMIQALSHGIFVPKNAGAGRRMHKPLIVTKTIDKASPLINTALCSGELLSQCRVEWFRTSAQGVQEHFYTMELEDAVIVGAEILMPHCQDPDTAHLTQLEKIHFRYRRIYWRHEVSRTMGSDEWQGEGQG